ncbi:MAG TPA: cobalamin biosynthesis protein [Streptosporangiaceae bacterium]
MIPGGARRRLGLALGLSLGIGLDALVGDPRRAHPVAMFGRAASLAESRLWADTRPRGVLFAVTCVAPVALLGWALDRLSRRDLACHVAVTAVATWAVLGGRSLGEEGLALARSLEAGDLAAARRRLPALCGRDSDEMDAAEVARAVVESVAENTCDAVVAPLLWGAVCGLPGLLGYRAVNTIDAMVGHRNPRYLRFGWAAARLDDIVNFPAARLTGVVAAMLAPAVGGRPGRALRILHSHGGAHPSPNSGPCEAAFAGALDVRLGGVNFYQGHPEPPYGPLGDGPPPTARDIVRTVRLTRLTSAVVSLLAVSAAYLLHGRRRT